MRTSRLEAFSDGVLAILITIMVLEMKAPEEVDLAALMPVLPVFLCYVLSFVYLGIYWNNHHHLLAATPSIDGAIMWANLHLLFWLSLVPFVTGWMGEHDFAPLPTAAYGVVLLMAAVAYYILKTLILRRETETSPLRRELGPDWKGRLSPVLYIVGIGLSLYRPWIACALYTLVALIWIVPDRRIERAVMARQTAE